MTVQHRTADDATPGELDVERELRRIVNRLAVDIGTRHAAARPEGLRAAAEFLMAELHDIAGLSERLCGQQISVAVRRRVFPVPGTDAVANLELEIAPRHEDVDEVHRPRSGRAAGGRSVPMALVGAHYDCGRTSPGANDNATGVAAVLCAARWLLHELACSTTGTIPLRLKRRVRFVLFANEEGPFFKTPLMGSQVYVNECTALGDRFEHMLCIDEIGYFSDEEGSQKYPPLIGRHRPRTGHFIGVIGDMWRRTWLETLARCYRAAPGVAAEVPAMVAALPYFLPKGGFSDEWPFHRAGVPAALLTDTGPMRYPAYHTPDDTPDQVDFGRAAFVTRGAFEMVRFLAADVQPEAGTG